MYYELYIDLFFLENFMMDSILLLLADHILKKRPPIRSDHTGRSTGKSADMSGDRKPFSICHQADSFP